MSVYAIREKNTKKVVAILYSEGWSLFQVLDEFGNPYEYQYKKLNGERDAVWLKLYKDETERDRWSEGWYDEIFLERKGWKSFTKKDCVV